MGLKGAKLNQEITVLAELLVEKLSVIEGITMKKLFGGYGVFHEGKMFGIIDSKGAYYLKADETNKGDFDDKGASKHSRMPYYTLPKDILDQQAELVIWVLKSIKASK